MALYQKKNSKRNYYHFMPVKMTESENQLAIYENVIENKNNITIEATAGSGKTTTLIGCSNLIPKEAKAIFLSFNKSIVEELKTKIRDGVDCSTLHSKGISFLYQHYGKIKVNDNKSFTFSDGFAKNKIKDFKKRFVLQIKIDEILKYSRMAMLSKYDEEGLCEIADIYGLDSSDDVLKGAIETYSKMSKYNEVKIRTGEFMVDFVDMVYLPAKYDIKVSQYDYVLIDECQDLSAMDLVLIHKLRGVNGRFIAVGDPYQNIYLFAGASSTAYESIKSYSNTVTLPLSVSYRCSKQVVLEARRYCETINHTETAIEGEVRWGTLDEVCNGDFVLCRNTKPLLDVYFSLVDRNVKCSIAGKDIEKKVSQVIKKYKDFRLSTLLEKLEDELLSVESTLLKRGISKPEKHKNYIAIEERNDILKLLSSKSNSMSDLKELISSIFKEDTDGVRLMTIHRSKGLEAENVFLARPDLIPSKYAETDLEVIQEGNLMFVAITRAKNKFIYLSN